MCLLFLDRFRTSTKLEPKLFQLPLNFVAEKKEDALCFYFDKNILLLIIALLGILRFPIPEKIQLRAE